MMVGRILNENDVYSLSIGDKIVLKPKESDKYLEATVIGDGIYTNGEKWQEIESLDNVIWTFPDDMIVCDFYYSSDNKDKEASNESLDGDFDF